MNFGDLKKYLRDGKRREDMIGVPRWSAGAGMTESVRQQVAEDEDKKEANKTKLAKTFLKVNLAQHDKTYHKGGYREGDECNFREALKRGDSADELAAAEKKEGNIKVGFVTFKEDEKTGKKEIVGVAEAEKVEVKGGEGGKVEVAGIGDGEGRRTKGEGGMASGRQQGVEDGGIACGRQQVVEDWTIGNLAEHDARFHPEGYLEGDTCRVREAMGRGDSADQVLAAETAEEKIEVDEGTVDAYLCLARPIYERRFKDGSPVKEADLPRVQALLDKFMLKHPEIAAVNEDAAYDLENAVGRTSGWHRNDAKAGVARVWCDDDVDMVVEELLDTPDGNMRAMFDCFYPESHFDDEEAERGRDEAYQQAVRLAVNWALHDKPEVWADNEEDKGWFVSLANGSAVNIGKLAAEAKNLIGAAAEQVARGNDPVERYLAAAM